MRKPLTNAQWNSAARALAGLDELPAHPVEPRGVFTTMPRRGPVVGFVGPDGKTHATDPTRTPFGGTLRASRCEPPVVAGAGYVTAFIANPKHPLCYGCVAAIEDEIRGEK